MTRKYIIPLPPVTKKNSPQIWRQGGRTIVAPSAKFLEYQQMAGMFLRPLPREPIGAAVEIKCLFFMPNNRRVDLTNLLGAIDDVLVHYGVLQDDHCNIVVSHDGSRVLVDGNRPRTEIIITEVRP